MFGPSRYLQSLAIQLFLFALSIGDAANAGEGFSFHADQLPSAVRPAWNATYTFIGDPESIHGTKVGTAWIAGVTKDSIYFVTNNHVVDDYCPMRGKCNSSATLVQDVNWPHGEFLSLKGLSNVFRTVEVVGRVADPDLALLRVKIPKSMAKPEALRIAESCDLVHGQYLYAIGFPGTMHRTAEGAKPIEDANILRKRWSSGRYVKYGYRLKNGAPESFLAALTTIDTLVGMSGRPILDEQGLVVGVGFQGRSEGGAYTGSEGTIRRVIGWMEPHSEHHDCVDLNEFLKTYRARHGF